MQIPISASSEIDLSVHEPTRLPANVPNGIASNRTSTEPPSDDRQRDAQIGVEDGPDRALRELLVLDQLRPRPLVTEVAAQQVRQVVDVLHELRPVEAEHVIRVRHLNLGQSRRLRVDEVGRLRRQRPVDREGEREHGAEREQPRSRSAGPCR